MDCRGGADGRGDRRHRRRDVEIGGGAGYAVSESGQVFEYGAGGWNEETTETGQNLRAVETGDPNVAVGDSSTVITD